MYVNKYCSAYAKICLMAKQKDPAAVSLGRKGGSVKGVKKGFATMDPDRLAAVVQKSAETRRKNAAKKIAQ
jgi:hypothetical protein